MRILFVNHTGARSGAENALLRLLAGLAPEHECAVACPAGGPLAAALDGLEVTRFEMPGTEVSLRLHPVHTARGLAGLLRSAVGTRRAARAFGAQVIHANSLRAGLIAVVARALGGPPVVVQSHEHLPPGRVSSLTRRVIARGAAGVMAVTDRTKENFDEGLSRSKAQRIYISIDHRRFDPELVAAADVRTELGLGSDAALLGEVAQLTPWKGQDLAIRALAALRQGVDAHLLVIGDVAFSSQRYDNEAYLRGLGELVAELEIEHAVHFMGHRRDVPALMKALDLLLLPSWDEPFGTVAAESMAMGTPPLVTSVGGVREYVEEGVNGLIIEPERHELWAEAAAELLGDGPRLAKMGRAGQRTAARFTDETYATQCLALYRRVLGSSCA